MCHKLGHHYFALAVYQTVIVSTDVVILLIHPTDLSIDDDAMQLKCKLTFALTFIPPSKYNAIKMFHSFLSSGKT